MIENLPVLAPDASRGARTVARCHARLAVRRRKIEARHRPAHRRTSVIIERLLLAGVCGSCLISMAADILSIVRAP